MLKIYPFIKYLNINQLQRFFLSNSLICIVGNLELFKIKYSGIFPRYTPDKSF